MLIGLTLCHPVGGRGLCNHGVSEPQHNEAPLSLAIHARREVAIFHTG
jgi:hypothetical protein